MLVCFFSRAIFASSTPIWPPSKVSFDADERLCYGSSSFRRCTVVRDFFTANFPEVETDRDSKRQCRSKFASYVNLG